MKFEIGDNLFTLLVVIVVCLFFGFSKSGCLESAEALIPAQKDVDAE